jgi:hypothetical protein
VRGRKKLETWNIRWNKRVFEDCRRLIERGFGAGRMEAKMGVEIGTGQVRVDQQDGLSQLGEVDGNVDGNKAFSHPAPSAAHRYNPSLTTCAGEIRLEDLGRTFVGHASGADRNAHAPKESEDAGAKLGSAERFGHVVVGSSCKSLDHVL